MFQPHRLDDTTFSKENHHHSLSNRPGFSRLCWVFFPFKNPYFALWFYWDIVVIYPGFITCDDRIHLCGHTRSKSFKSWSAPGHTALLLLFTQGMWHPKHTKLVNLQMLINNVIRVDTGMFRISSNCLYIILRPSIAFWTAATLSGVETSTGHPERGSSSEKTHV